jgi:hypothetical protein
MFEIMLSMKLTLYGKGEILEIQKYYKLILDETWRIFRILIEVCIKIREFLIANRDVSIENVNSCVI